MNTELTANELRAALVLVKECLAGMGGSRPSDLEHDEYTWVDTDMLRYYGWSRPEANGTFGALISKGFIFEADTDQMALTTEAWRWLDTQWDSSEFGQPTLEEITKVEEKETKMTQTANFIVKITSALGLTFDAPIFAADAAAAIREARAAVKLAGISRKVGTINFRAVKA